MTLWNGDTPVMCEYALCHKSTIEIILVHIRKVGSSSNTCQAEISVYNNHSKEFETAGMYFLERSSK